MALAMNLNAGQSQVRDCRARRAIILAGAGTGKTASATHHVASLIQSGVAPSSILQITFTRKAAQEMVHRVRTLTGLQPEDEFPAIGTYHAIASALIRENPRGYGFSRGTFTLLDKSDASHVMGMAFGAAQIKKGELVKPSSVLETLSYCLNAGEPLKNRYEEVFEKEAPNAMAATQHYTRLKREGGMADFEDLLTLWRDRLAFDPAYAKLLRSVWTHVIVDEFQDNNPLNFDILKGLDPEHLLVIGDKQQSIYGFRGANCKLIETFMAQSPDAEVIKLEENYRSGQKILDLANRVVSSASVALSLRAFSTARAMVNARTFADDREEAAAAVTWIEHGDVKGVPRNETAFLARSTRTLVPLEARLKAAGIPYRKYGGVHISDAAEIRDFISLVRLTINPQDTAALRKVLVLFPKIGDKSAEKAALALTRDVNAPWPEKAAAVPRWLEAIRQSSTLEESLRTAQGFLVPLLRVQSAYQSTLPARLDNLNQVIATGASVASSLPEFIDAFALSKEAGDEHPEGSVTLSTIHSAKGLEWKRVWVVGVGDQQMPHPNARGQEELEEEMRLLYVAVTRAKDDLLVSYPTKTMMGREQKVCRYLPDDLLWRSFMAPAVISTSDIPRSPVATLSRGPQK
jgi:DNA helicase-2/ATP-dependent DNA helicase PcrA